MPEPKRLSRGKKFQKLVQEDFSNNNKDGKLGFEKTRNLLNNKKGRLDILITELSDDVAIYEIKATDWDKIKPKNIKKNAWRHQHQLINYVETYVELNISVWLGIIYPAPSKTPGLREILEKYLESYGTPAYWFTEIKSS